MKSASGFTGGSTLEKMIVFHLNIIKYASHGGLWVVGLTSRNTHLFIF